MSLNGIGILLSVLCRFTITVISHTTVGGTVYQIVNLCLLFELPNITIIWQHNRPYDTLNTFFIIAHNSSTTQKDFNSKQLPFVIIKMEKKKQNYLLEKFKESLPV